MANKATRLLLWTTAIGMLILAATAVAVLMLTDVGPPSFDEEPEWLHVKMSGQMAESPGADALLVDPLDMPPLTTELSAAIRHAATDDDISGLFIEIYPLAIGWAATQEVRDAINIFVESGKPCRAWADALMNKEYYLASACGQLEAAPTGIILVNGLSITRSYYKDTLDKIGVTPNFEHVGDFKSAVEPYERTGPSESAAEASGAMLDSLYGQLVQGIADGRGVDFEVAAGWVNDPPVSVDTAVASGMLDGVLYRDQILDDLDADTRKLSSYLRDLRESWASQGDRVAVIYVEGAIVSGSSSSDLFGSQYVGDRTVRKQLEKVRDDESIKVVVLRVNSPGGSGQASDAIWREVERTREEKPVVVSMGDYAASGGYYISMGSDRIFAEPGTITGSIGVFGGKMNLAGAYEKVGVHLYTEQRGDYANLFSSTSNFADHERAKYKAFLQAFYDTFVNKAAEGRGTQYDVIHEVAQGRVWTGEQALERGLVDELGGLDAAIAYAVELGGLENADRVLRIPERKGFVEALLEELTNPEDGGSADARATLALEALPADIRAALAEVSTLEHVLGPTGGAITLLPGAPTIR